MGNWEIKNDSTTNYLRVQDQIAQNPIDFYEDGTLEAPAVGTDETSYTGLALAVYRNGSSWDWEAFDSIQAAVDAVPTDSGGRAEGGVLVGPKGQNDYWNEQVVIDKRMNFGSLAAGISTHIAPSTSGPSVRIEGNADDTLVNNLWIDNRGSGRAIESVCDETRIEWVNVDDAGDGTNAIWIDGLQPTINNVEIKAGGVSDPNAPAVELSTNAYNNHVNNLYIHDEFSKGMAYGLRAPGLGKVDATILLKSGTVTDSYGVQLTNEKDDYRWFVTVSKPSGVTGDAVDTGLILDGATGGDVLGSARNCASNSVSLTNASDVSLWGHYPQSVSSGDLEGNRLNGTGMSAASALSTPSESHWKQSDVIINKADGVVWVNDPYSARWIQQSAATARNLSGLTGPQAGFLAYDDGTNTTGSGALCQWDSTNTQWIPFDGSATFA